MTTPSTPEAPQYPEPDFTEVATDWSQFPRPEVSELETDTEAESTTGLNQFVRSLGRVITSHGVSIDRIRRK